MPAMPVAYAPMPKNPTRPKSSSPVTPAWRLRLTARMPYSVAMTATPSRNSNTARLRSEQPLGPEQQHQQQQHESDRGAVGGVEQGAGAADELSEVDSQHEALRERQDVRGEDGPAG